MSIQNKPNLCEVMNPQEVVSQGYPLFRARQVLRDEDLNNVVKYLDQHLRLTRTYLVGMGIVGGLEVKLEQEPVISIAITEGCGITSDGYLIYLNDMTLKRYQTVIAPECLWRQTVTEAPQYLNVIELFEKEGEPLKQDMLNGIVIVFYQIENEIRDDCSGDCDDVGKDRQFRLRFFLLPVEPTGNRLNASDLNNKLDFEEQPVELRYSFMKDCSPQAFQFGYTQKNYISSLRSLNSIESYEDLVGHYRNICKATIDEIDRAFSGLQLFSPTIFVQATKHEDTDSSTLRDLLLKKLQEITPEEGVLDRQKTLALQYFYDYLRQVTIAFEELAEVAFDLMEDTTPPLKRFPRFLMLGNPASNGSGYRSYFTQPPIYNSNQQRVKRVRHLSRRLRFLSEPSHFNLSEFDNVAEKKIKITPSRTRSSSLGQQAIPYYLTYDKSERNGNNQVQSLWSYEAYRKGLSKRLPAYHSATEQEPFELFYHDLSDTDFYRIEGHIGKPFKQVTDEVLRLQKEANLAFDIIHLQLPAAAQSEGQKNSPFHRFAEDHPGLEPLCGVTKGGTFVLVCVGEDENEQIVVADFCLPYLCWADLNEPPSGTVMLAEESSSQGFFSPIPWLRKLGLSRYRKDLGE